MTTPNNNNKPVPTTDNKDVMQTYNYNNFLDTMLTSLVYKNISNDGNQSITQSVKYMFLVSLVPEVKRVLTEFITFLLKKVPELIYKLPELFAYIMSI